MTSPRAAGTAPRSALTRARVLESAVTLADRDGLGALTMRSLARELGIEAMSLYHHVANKEDLLDGVVDVVAAEIQDAVGRLEALPDDAPESSWKPALRRQILAARTVLLRHPWASTVLESRKSFSLHVVRYYDSLIGLMRRGGFSYDLVHHAMHALGSRALGFSQELFEPDGATAGSAGDGSAEEGAADAATALLLQMADELPHMVEMLAEVGHQDTGSTLGWCDDQTEFEFGLDLILDGLERLAEREKP
ncbi:transcriptional regulator, TetR family [Promicromonospora umidemergens]|uniref:TetR/AcrR family transcriptional regulator C-terminal domain-containing protein n=1 Tax=Promicromonospora umidemergens TaxID=629679 RepID=A0ABP8X4D2_9MICO|nr:TetR/AcrR family transcriptional regulator C-terminal domain-containing protein [Promicromonospora umidemergens]MCP2286657.1 transcriptional regulator, TetR family [Promicromonospora umidemergens]